MIQEEGEIVTNTATDQPSLNLFASVFAVTISCNFFSQLITVAKINCHDDNWCKENLHLDADVTVAFKGKGLKQYEVFHGRF